MDNEKVISLFPQKVCELFGEKSMSVEIFLTKLNELSDSIQKDENQIRHLKDEISYEIISNSIILSSIQNKKYQLSLSQSFSLKRIRRIGLLLKYIICLLLNIMEHLTSDD